MNNKLHSSIGMIVISIILTIFFIYGGLLFGFSKFSNTIRYSFIFVSLSMCLFFIGYIFKWLMITFSLDNGTVKLYFNNKTIKEINILDITGIYFDSYNGSSIVNICTPVNKLVIPYSGYKLKREINNFIQQNVKMIESKTFEQLNREGIVVRNKNNKFLYKFDNSGIYIYKINKLIPWDGIKDIKIINYNSMQFYTFITSDKITFSDYHINGNLGFPRYLKDKINLRKSV